MPTIKRHYRMKIEIDGRADLFDLGWIPRYVVETRGRCWSSDETGELIDWLETGGDTAQAVASKYESRYNQTAQQAGHADRIRVSAELLK